jgi:hypothetical protein
LGGTAVDGELVRGLAVDGSGVYAVGFFHGTIDFDPGLGVTEFSSAGGSDAFLLKLDSEGNFMWARTFGGVSDDSANAVTLDDNGNVYLVGQLGSASVASFTPAGDFRWAEALGSAATGVATSASAIYVAGSFSGTVDFGLGPGIALLTAGSVSDVFLVKTTIFRSPGEGIGSLINDVMRLASVLNGGQLNSLIQKLENALRSVDNGGSNSACGQLKSFGNGISAMVLGGTLSESQAQPLLALLMEIQSSLGCK